MRYRAAVNGNRDITDIAQAPRLTFGVRGSAAGWEFDSAVLHSASQVREHNNDGWPVLTKLLPLLNSGTVNFFGDNTPAVQAQLRASNFHGDAYTISSSLSSVNGRATHELLALPGGPLALALGVEVRQEHFRFNPSKEISEGDIAGYGGSLAYTNRSRDVDAVFAELNLPITKTLEANAAVRHDRYQGVGRSTTPKLSLRWQPVPALLLRGAVGKGFRAPSLADLFTHTTTGVSLQGLTDPIRCPTTEDPIRDCQTQFATTNGGNVALKPETAQNTTFGLVFEPVKGASVSLDFFAINLKNAISNGVPATSILGDPAKYAAYLTRGPVDPAFPALPGPIINIDQHNLNLGQVRLAGLDFDARWKIAAGDWGQFTLALSGTYFSKYDTQNPDGTFSPGVDQVNTSTGGVVPRLKTYQSLTWSRGPWESTVAVNWQKGYDDIAATLPPFATRQVSAYTTADVQVGYSGFKGVKLALGVRHLFNQDPPYTNTGGQTSFQSGYDQQYGDPRGRFIYRNASYAFR